MQQPALVSRFSGVSRCKEREKRMKKNLASYPDRFVTCVLPSEAGLFQLRNTITAVLYVTVSCSDVILHYDCMSFGGSKFFSASREIWRGTFAGGTW